MSAKNNLVRCVILLAIATVTVITASILHDELRNRRSGLGRILRTWKGECRIEQYANDLAQDLQLAQLQPWAMATMAQFRSGRLRGERGNHLPWPADDVELSAQETPGFISKQWGETNQFGVVFPSISIVLSNNQPEYLVISWGYGARGVVVGSPDYRLSFSPDWTNEVGPGIYTYYCVH